eukprot:TRINITY_DN18368_c0_g1_i1.p1 TRINITY_DN18368_c0_g1~~TRINITY_DN18368_c0_g1_i1.p1  ORF type:complete len:116 (+),score=23.09 TRINITY_DN18368_c0_g1_i1:244-591(+)
MSKKLALDNQTTQQSSETTSNIHLFIDNQSTIAINDKRSAARRTKHIDTRDLWLRDSITSGKVQVTYIPTAENISNILTKPLGLIAFKRLRDQFTHDCGIIPQDLHGTKRKKPTS